VRRAAAGLALLAILGLGACSSQDESAPPVPSTTAVSGSITVSAASSLTGAFTTIAAGFAEANPGATATLNFGSSSVLATQIQQGAPVDTFASADTATIDTLRTASLVAGAPQVFARNRLVIVTKPGNPEGITTVSDLADAGTIALCATTAPCGKYAAQVLTNARTTIPESTVTRGPDAKSTIAAVTTGDADAAIVYVTDAKAAGSAVTSVPIPMPFNVVAVYPIATLAAAKHAAVSKAFIEYVLSPKGQTVLRSAGFLPAAPTP
jgi:molybdate transport system substrate-binding protein